MAYKSNLSYFAGITARRLFLEADKGGKTGNSSDAPEGTLKAQLDQAKTKITDLEGKLQAAEGLQTKVTDLEGQLKAANEAKETAEKAQKEADQARADAEAKVKTLEGEKTELSDKVGTLTKDRERLSAAGLNKGTTKQPPEQLDASAGDPIALWQSYQSADGLTKAQMRKEHGAKLDAAAAAFDREQAGK